MKEKLESICFFLDTGRTFTFRDVTLVTDNETVWVIDYRAMSDKLWKKATFYKIRVVGVAKCYAMPAQMVGTPLPRGEGGEFPGPVAAGPE